MSKAEHVRLLARAFNVTVMEVPGMPPDKGAAGFLSQDKLLLPDDRRKCIRIAPIHDDSTYAVALHELGHAIHPLGMCLQLLGSDLMRTTNNYDTLRDVRLKLLEEESAWEWARHYALEWTELMSYVERLGLDSYRKTARRFGVRV